MPTVEHKVMSVFDALETEKITQENLYLKVLDKFPDTKMTTFTRVLYILREKGVVCRTEDGFYVRGEQKRTQKLMWPDSLQEH